MLFSRLISWATSRLISCADEVIIMLHHAFPAEKNYEHLEIKEKRTLMSLHNGGIK